MEAPPSAGATATPTSTLSLKKTFITLSLITEVVSNGVRTEEPSKTSKRSSLTHHLLTLAAGACKRLAGGEAGT